MTLDGANVFHDTTDYSIYTMNSATTGKYCVVLPKNNTGTYNMLVDLHFKNSFDLVSSGSKTKEQLIEEIKEEYTGVKTKYSDGILVIPMIDEISYVNAIVNNDKQKMFDEVKKIGAITSEIYKKLTTSGIDKQRIDQKIIIIEKNNDDTKFVEWLKEQMPNFVIGINSNELKPVTNTNPFMNSESNIFGEPAQNNNDSIFDAPSIPNNDIFSATNTKPNPSLVAEPIPAPSIPPVVEPTITQSVSSQTVEPVQNPTPVQSTPLEATTTIQPVTNDTRAQTTPEGQQGETSSTPEKKGGKGFTNLLILLVVLVVVTLISIELGKFLYNTYGV